MIEYPSKWLFVNLSKWLLVWDSFKVFLISPWLLKLLSIFNGNVLMLFDEIWCRISVRLSALTIMVLKLTDVTSSIMIDFFVILLLLIKKNYFHIPFFYLLTQKVVSITIPEQNEISPKHFLIKLTNVRWFFQMEFLLKYFYFLCKLLNFTNKSQTCPDTYNVNLLTHWTFSFYDCFVHSFFKTEDKLQSVWMEVSPLKSSSVFLVTLTF